MRRAAPFRVSVHPFTMRPRPNETRREERNRMPHGLQTPWPLVLAAVLSPAEAQPPPRAVLRFEVRCTLDAPPRPGRLFVILGKPDGVEPRLALGQTGLDAHPSLARDVDGMGRGKIAVLDASVRGVPDRLARRPAPGRIPIPGRVPRQSRFESSERPGRPLRASGHDRCIRPPGRAARSPWNWTGESPPRRSPPRPTSSSS